MSTKTPNPAFERDSPEAGEPLNFTLEVFMNWHTELTELLPTKWSRWTAGSSILLSVAAYNLPSLLPEQLLAMSPVTLFLVKLLLSETTLLIGSFVVILLVVRAHNAKKVTVTISNLEIPKLDNPDDCYPEAHKD